MSEINVDASVVPTATPGATAPGKGPKYNEDANLLDDAEDSDVTTSDDEEDEDKTPLTETDEEDKEESEEDEEENPEDSEKPNIPFDRPTIKEIKTKFPDLFKEFPTLREAYFREAAFSELFPTVEDAKEAFNDNEAFTTLSDAVLSGDPEPLLESIEKTDKKALEVFSLSFLPALMKRDNELYSTVVTPLFQNLVQQLFKDKDENTRNAALVLADWIFGSDGEAIAQGKKSVAQSIKPTEEQAKIKTQKEAANSTAFRQSAGKVQGTVERGLESLIFKSPSFDPDKVFSPSLRRMGAQEVIKQIMAQMSKDSGHMAIMAARWKRARANGYTADDESKIVSAYLARAKSLIPGAASKVSSAMLGTKKAASVVKSDKVRTFSKENNSGRSSGSNGKSSSQLDYSKMSDIDILNS